MTVDREALCRKLQAYGIDAAFDARALVMRSHKGAARVAYFAHVRLGLLFAKQVKYQARRLATRRPR